MGSTFPCLAGRNRTVERLSSSTTRGLASPPKSCRGSSTITSAPTKPSRTTGLRPAWDWPSCPRRLWQARSASRCRAPGAGHGLFARFSPSAGGGNGDRSNLPRPASGWCPPGGCFAQIGPVPFSLAGAGLARRNRYGIRTHCGRRRGFCGSGAYRAAKSRSRGRRRNGLRAGGPAHSGSAPRRRHSRRHVSRKRYGRVRGRTFHPAQVRRSARAAAHCRQPVFPLGLQQPGPRSDVVAGRRVPGKARRSEASVREGIGPSRGADA